MIQVNMHEAKTNLSKLIEQLSQGEEIVIARGNKPVAKLVLLDEIHAQRKIGSARGLITMDSSFDEPLEDFADYMS